MMENPDAKDSSFINLSKTLDKKEHNISPAPSKLIHFIWVGHTFLSKRGQEVIKKWAAKYINNSEWKIYVWVDERSASKSWSQLKEHYHNLLGLNNYSNISIMDIESVKGKNSSFEKYFKFIRYEIDRLDPNYGAASDLLRYLILLQYGGCYFDIDVEPGDDIISLEETGDFLYIEHKSQQPKLEGKDKVVNTDFPDSKKNEQIGNDSFGCNQNNVLMSLLTLEVMKNFTPSVLFKRYKEMFTDEQAVSIKLAYGAKDVSFHAIRLTGPDFFKDILFSQKKQPHSLGVTLIKVQDQSGDRDLKLKVFRCSQYSYTLPLPNLRTWDKISIIASPNLEKAISKTLAAIQFEHEKFSIIRLDDHIINICKSVFDQAEEDGAERQKEVNELIERLLKEVENLPLDYSKAMIQCLYKFKPSINFCRKNGKIYLSEESLLLIFRSILNESAFCKMLEPKPSHPKYEFDFLEESEAEPRVTCVNEALDFVINYFQFLHQEAKLTTEIKENSEKFLKKLYSEFGKQFTTYEYLLKNKASDKLKEPESKKAKEYFEKFKELLELHQEKIVLSNPASLEHDPFLDVLEEDEVLKGLFNN